MEENRRKALEKRAMRQAQIGPKADQNRNVLTSTSNPTSFYSSPRIPQHSATPSPKQSSRFTGPPSSGATSVSKTNPKPNTSSSSGRPVANFQLISRNKFCVEAPFDNEMIEIFKKFPNKTYDGANRKWTFSINDHQALLQSLSPLLHRFQLQPLPKFVLDIFRYISLSYCASQG